MSFGGGGSGALPNHEHTNIPLDGGPLDFVNTTIASLSAGSLTYSSGAALQELGIGGAGTVLGSDGASPAWVANTANPLIKVTKTFADIDLGTASMDIYTLPQDAAAVNIWADITTVFDLSTGVTIGDSLDDNGFAEATDWTAGTGLTDATRGAYITSFKTMLSTTGSTDIKAYNFSTSGTAPVKDAQATANSSSAGTTITNAGFTVAANSNRILVVCAVRYDGSGGDISGITWNGTENFTRAVFRDSTSWAGGRSEIWYLINPTATTADIVTTWNASTGRRGAGVYSYYNCDQTTPIGVTNTADGIDTTTTGTITPTTTGSLIVDVEVSSSNVAATDTLTAGWTDLINGGSPDRSFSSQYDLTPTIGVSNNMFYSFPAPKGWNWCSAEIKPFVSGTDTQGEVDFYLQVVD